MIEAIYFTGAIIGILFPIGVLMLWYLNKCNHSWSLIEDLEIMKPIDGVNRKVGFTKVYECVHCKKIKTETYRL
jgi:hypothetical protein